MKWFANLFGAVGGRTQNIVSVIVAYLVFFGPVIMGLDIPGVGVEGVKDWAGFPSLVPIYLSILTVLGGTGTWTWLDKSHPSRNLVMFGEGTKPITPTLVAVADVVSVPNPPNAPIEK